MRESHDRGRHTVFASLVEESADLRLKLAPDRPVLHFAARQRANE